uniref:Fe2OG dioxygenase domain-containing protein n=2 Tax=Ditylum brightwellii TaxID=49249 RepID=A0A6U3T5F4_9STRA|mmetsp:Transcript_36031/g.53734  ORF Transcript_36031/g.53734 Transcript_36031/m.53734 type:complete len:489 (+) Transcript_36031:244-1710(+)
MKNEYKSSSTSNRSVTQELQISCHTPADVLSNAGLKLLSSLSSSSPSPLEGKEKINHVMSMSSLILVRLSKLLISRDNARLHDRHHNNDGGDDDSVIWDGRNQNKSMNKILQDVCCIFAESITQNALLVSNGEGEQEQQQQQRREENYWDAPVEGIKAAAVISRILYSNSNFNANKNDKIDTKTMMTAKDTFGPLAQSFQHVNAKELDSHHLSGLRWAYDCLQCTKLQRQEEKEEGHQQRLGSDGDENTQYINSIIIDDGVFCMPAHLVDAHKELNLPFRIWPGFISSSSSNSPHLTVPNIQSEVSFLFDTITTTSTGIAVQERRGTAWQGDDPSQIPGFAYSGKIMDTKPFSPLVHHVRTKLEQKTGIQYDCCLLNLYPHGKSGMRYHIDPDQGTLWDYETAVVSIGSSRRFAFRPIAASMKEEENENQKQQQQQQRVHNFVVMNGDVTEMFGDCQTRFQHAVKTAEGKDIERTPRASLVYKKSFSK